jgi:hypothetical protein
VNETGSAGTVNKHSNYSNLGTSIFNTEKMDYSNCFQALPLHSQPWYTTSNYPAVPSNTFSPQKNSLVSYHCLGKDKLWLSFRVSVLSVTVNEI